MTLTPPPRGQAFARRLAVRPVHGFIHSIEQWTANGQHLLAAGSPRVLPDSQVAAGSVQKAVIVETKKEFQRADGSTLRFDRNACVLVNAKGMPIGSRVLGFVTHELRARNLMKARNSLSGHHFEATLC